MVNVLKLMENANSRFMIANSDELGIDYKLFKSIATRCGYSVLERKEGYKKLFKLRKSSIPLVKLYPYEQDNTFNFLDISDIHVGNKMFDPDKLRSILEAAKKRNVRQVFIAGDIFEAVYDSTEYDFRIMSSSKQKYVEKRFKDELYRISKIFAEYPFDYYAINGNHEYEYEQLGIESPIKQLEEKLRRYGVNFNSYDTYIVDFLIAGVIKRVMHLESFYTQKTVCASLERLYEFNRHGGLNVKISENEKVPIRFLECGHVHLTMELYSGRHNVYVMQPGSLIVTENPYESGIFARGEVTKERNIVRY